MSKKKLVKNSHPKGDKELAAAGKRGVAINAYSSSGKIVWDRESNVTQFGQMPFFIDFLKTTKLFDSWVESCPLKYASHNAPEVRDLLGTIMISILAGHKRYAHITSIRSDRVNPALLGMKKVVSEDSVRRGFSKIDEEAGADWLRQQLKNSYDALLSEPWILDIDTTVKPLYGHQEGAVVGYNPTKPGRPSHVYHSYVIGNLRLVLDVETQAGNESSSAHAQPGLWNVIDDLAKSHRPHLIRGDCGFGNDKVMLEAESRGLDYLFKLKQTNNVKRLISRSISKNQWTDAGQGWEGIWDSIKLVGWTDERLVLVLRRKLKGDIVLVDSKKTLPQQIAFIEVEDGAKYEYSVLVTSRKDDVLTVAQLYRDRADVENIFDEMKNQWSWGGFTTRDLSRCKLMARISALVFNWWSLFSGLVLPNKHAEAITSRPLLLYGVGRQTTHAGQQTITVTSSHGKSKTIENALRNASGFLLKIRNTAEQLTSNERWKLILSRIFARFLKGRILGPPKLIAFYPA